MEGKKIVSGLHHAALKCCGEAEFEKTVAFYTDVMGMTVCRTWGEGVKRGAMIDTGNGGIMEIFANAEEPLPQGAVRHVAFLTEDADEAVRVVTEAGYTVFDGPRDVTLQSNPPLPIRVAFFNGPVGEEIELFQIREAQ